MKKKKERTEVQTKDHTQSSKGTMGNAKRRKPET